jgi:hypothetical protein
MRANPVASFAPAITVVAQYLKAFREVVLAKPSVNVANLLSMFRPIPVDMVHS